MKKRMLSVAIAGLLSLGAVGVSQSSENLQSHNQQGSVPASIGMLTAAEESAMDVFINDLMSKMTVAEKIGQMNLLTSDMDVTGPTIRANYKEDIRKGRVGALFNAFTPEYTLMLQRMAVEETRLGIPLLFGYDVIHGHKTIFPISLGESASWDLQAIETGARVAAKEAAADGIHWTFAPMIDIARDPRWGRISESAGEDVYLSQQIAKARVQGFQGNDLSAIDTVLACAKHFAAYGQAQAGRDYHTTDMSRRELWETYLPPFKATVDAGIATFMTAFNDLNGVPATGNKYLLDEVLREKWGFDGFVVTDYTSINEMIPHGFAEDSKHAAELALNAGVDMDMQSSAYHEHINTLLEEGKVSVSQIDNAARRILELKYKLGLFEDPYRYSNKERAESEILTPAHLDASRDMARKSMVLLKNQQQTLPLQNKYQSLALIGPLANSKADMVGSWAGAGHATRDEQPISILQGLQQRAGKDIKINYAKGASYQFEDSGSTQGFADAIKAAMSSDVIIVAMGEKWDMSGEAASRTSLDMPGNQRALLKELKKLNKPIVMVLLSGRPMSITWEQENLDSILMAWYPGTMGGHAIADVLFGDYNPSGKLPVTFPRNVGQVPLYYNMKNTGRPVTPEQPGYKYKSRYLNTPNSPLYPFGYGLSYTSFEYSPASLITEQDVLKVSVEVTNTGNFDGEEVVQLYVQDKVGSVTRPVKELKGFSKVMINKGETKRVNFELSTDDLAFYKNDLSYAAEAGSFNLFIGTDSQHTSQAEFILEHAPNDNKKLRFKVSD